MKEYASEKIKLSDLFIFLWPGLENGPRPTRRPRASRAQATTWAWAGFLSARLGQIWPKCRPTDLDRRIRSTVLLVSRGNKTPPAAGPYKP